MVNESVIILMFLLLHSFLTTICIKIAHYFFFKKVLEFLTSVRLFMFVIFIDLLMRYL